MMKLILEAKDLRKAYGDRELFHYLAYTAILSYYWYVWGLYRESSGVIMGEGLYHWRNTAKRFSAYLLEHDQHDQLNGHEQFETRIQAVHQGISRKILSKGNVLDHFSPPPNRSAR